MHAGPVAVRRMALLAGTLLVLGSLLGGGPAMADSDRIGERAVVTYRLDRKQSAIDVTVRLTITNQVPDTPTTRYYLTTWGYLWIPTYARQVRISGPGVTARRVSTGFGFGNYMVTFPRLFHGRSMTIRAAWTLPSRGANSDFDTYVSRAYSHFCWTGQPVDTGSVTSVVQSGATTISHGSKVRVREHGSYQELQGVARTELAAFGACTDIYDEALLATRELVSPGGHHVLVQGWPDDPTWLDATTTAVADALASDEAIVGARLPGDRALKIREVANNALRGYAGDFDTDNGVIRVSQRQTDPGLLAHELAHGWFNAETFGQVWMSEGLAEWTARQTSGQPCRMPEYPGPGKPRLATWQYLGFRADVGRQGTVAYQYAAACAIMQAISDATGPDQMRVVLAALLSGVRPYDVLPGCRTLDGRTSVGGAIASTVSGSTSREPVGWRRFVDAVDQLGRAPGASLDADLTRRLLTSQGIARSREFTGRSAARARFGALQALAPGCVTPAAVRRPMSAWEFPAAQRSMDLATRIAVRLRALGDAPEAVALWTRYEAAATDKGLRRLRDDLPAAVPAT